MATKTRKRKPRQTKAAAPATPAYTVEIAGTDERSFRDVFDLILAEHAEVAYEPLAPEKAAENCYRTLEGGMTLIARDAEGTAIGTLGIIELPYWYSHGTYLQDVWLYVAPEHRGGGVLRAMLTKAKEFADARNKILIATIANPNRRIKKTALGLVAQEAGYVPFMYSLRVA